MPAPRRSLPQRETYTPVSVSNQQSDAANKIASSPVTPSSAKAAGTSATRIAIDLGSYSIRIAIVKPGDDRGPINTTCCPNAIVKLSQKRHIGTTAGGLLAGPQITQKCHNFGSLTIRQPMDRGMIVDWPTQKLVLDAALVDALAQAGVNTKPGDRLLEGLEVIMTEAYFNLPDLQSSLDVLLLEGYGASKIWRCAPALLIPYHLDLFSTNTHTLPTPKKRRRPECICIVDLGHNATHVVPVIQDSIIWKSVRRHIISQRILTNLLKETISFRQWDMMDESWLVGHVKEECCFVASHAGKRGEVIDRKNESPSQWTYAGMLEMCADLPQHQNPLMLEYVLPDYADTSSRGTLGHIRGQEGKGKGKAKSLDEFIAGATSNPQRARKVAQRESEDEATDDDSDDDDFREGSSEPASTTPSKKKRKKQQQKSSSTARREVAEEEEEDIEQVLILERERFQVPEVMFDPGMIGLDDDPLHEVIGDSIKSCEEEIQDLLWSNIVLVGGGARMRGLRERLMNELRSRAPAEIPMHIFCADDPSLSAIKGAQSLLLDTTQRLSQTRYVSASGYTQQAAQDRFGSWSNVLLPQAST